MHLTEMKIVISSLTCVEYKEVENQTKTNSPVLHKIYLKHKKLKSNQSSAAEGLLVPTINMIKKTS